jgi:hypothetical protein
MSPFDLFLWSISVGLVLLAMLGAVNLALRQMYVAVVRARTPTEQAAFLRRSRRTVAITRAAILVLLILFIPFALAATTWRPNSFLPFAVAWLLLVANLIEIYHHRKWLASHLEETHPAGDQEIGAA